MTTAQNTHKNIIKALLITFFALLSSVAVFGQESKGIAHENATMETSTVATENSNNMVSWFMGTKQTPKSTINDNGASDKKMMINSGVEPNRILMKSFLKKASNYQTATA